jgi:hypothetical protein
VPRVYICDDDDEQQQQENKIKMIMSAIDVWFPVPGGNNCLQGLTVTNQTATPRSTLLQKFFNYLQADTVTLQKTCIFIDKRYLSICWWERWT